MKTYHYSLAATLVAIVTIPAARADYSSTVMGLNPVAYYRLNETTPVPADTATNLGTAGINGTALYINTPLHQAPGALPGSTDTAVGLNGTSQRVATPFDASINPTGPFTAEAWVNPAVSDTGTYCPMSYWTEASAPVGRTGWLIYQTSGGWNLRTYNGINSTPIVSVTAGGTPVPSTWYHLAVVYDGSTVNLYVNGVPTGPQATTGYAPNIGGPFSIGARSDGGFWFTGYADEAALYTNALSADVILAHYQNGTNASPSQTYNSLVLGNHPVLYYRLDEPDFAGGTPVTAANLGNLATAADGTYEAGAITGVAGPPFAGFGAGNTAMRISSLAGDVVIADGLPINTDTFTITAWFERSGQHLAGQALVFDRYTGNSATGLGFGYNGSPGVDELDVHWNEGPSSWLTGLTPPNDLWCFGAAVYTPTNVTVYLDNLTNTFNTALAAHDFSPAPVYIGFDNAPYPRFGGSIADVALFDRALSPAEVQSLLSGSQMPGQILSLTRTPPDPLFEGYNITMTAAVAGVPPLTNQWYKDNRLLTGKTNSTFSIPNAAVGDSGNYTLVVSDTYGSSTSVVQHITVSAGPPLILSQIITNATRAIGGRVVYSVVAGGSAPISYVWKRGSTPVPGGTNSVLVLSNLQLSDQGSYTVTLSNPYGVNTNSATGVVSVFTVTNFPFAGMYGNPLAYYRLNETSGTTALDIASGLNGTLNGPIVTGVPGPQPPTWDGFESTNTAFQFDGASTRVQLPPFNLLTTNLTFVTWINPAGPQLDQAGILVSRNGNELGGLFLNYVNNGTPNNALGYVWAGTGSYTHDSGLIPVVGQWNFVALVIEPQKGTLYLDTGDGTGLQSWSYIPTGTEANQLVVFSSGNIGVDSPYPRFFNGSIDEVAVYDRSLSPSELANLDLLGTAGPVAPRIQQQPASQAVYAGQSAAFTVGALGALPLAYQWHHDTTNLPGATSSTLLLPSVYYTDAGSYDVVITNGLGSSNSVTVTLAVLAPPLFANLTNGLVLHLKFDGDYLDSSGRTNNATPVGSPTLVPGKLGQAMHYNTDNSDPNNVIYNYATLGSPPDLQFGTSQNFSVSYWIRFTGGSVDLPVLCNNECGEGCAGFFLGPAYYTSGAWAWAFENSSYSAGIDADGAANSINDGQWHNVVSTFDRTGLGMTYLDAVLVDARPISTFTDTLDTAHTVNVGQVGTADYKVAFGADVDDLGVWLRALSPTEAQGIYLVGVQGKSFDTYGPVILSLSRAGNDLQLVWQTGTLLSSTNGVNGTYNPVSGASAPYYRVTPGPTPTFYRVRF